MFLNLIFVIQCGDTSATKVPPIVSIFKIVKPYSTLTSITRDTIQTRHYYQSYHDLRHLEKSKSPEVNIL